MKKDETNNYLIIPTSNKLNGYRESAVAIDMGTVRFAAMVDTWGNVTIEESRRVLDICREVWEGKKDLNFLETFIAVMVKKYVDEWYKDGIEAVYVGCCKGNFLKLCNGNKNSYFYKYGIFKSFVKFVDIFCKECGIYVETVECDESYTSLSNSLNSDFVHSYGDDNVGKQTGKIDKGNYFADSHLVINADVNACLNLLHKKGHNLYVAPDSNLFDYITLL